MNSNVLDLSKVNERRELVASSDGAALIQAIERAARDPNVDIAKMERLFAMRKEIAAEMAEAAFNQAMTACQMEMRPISADAENSQTHSRYATFAKLDRALRPIYTRHGFALSFDELDSPKPEYVRVVCYVSHTAGHTRTYRRDMPADGKGAKGGDVMTKTHAVGAANSYGARYILKGVFNVAVGEDDQDGNEPQPGLSEEQAANLKALLSEVGANEGAFLKWARVRSLSEILACNYEYCVKAIEAKRDR